MSSVIEELGEEGEEDVKKGKITTRDAMAAAEDIKRARKAGKVVEPKAALAKARAKGAIKAAKGKKKADRRVGSAEVYRRYSALPRMNTGAKLLVAEGALEYLAGVTDDLPKELAANTGADEE